MVNEEELLNPRDFKSSLDGKKTYLFTLRNESGCVAQICNYGARLVSLWIPDQKGVFSDIILGFSTIDQYLKANEKYHGATIGRFANRIANGEFELEGKKYKLASNNGDHHLHGGSKGFESVIWDANQVDSSSLQLSYLSIHMEEGYPGNLHVQIKYQLTDDNQLRIEYVCTTDQTTVVNLTHHSYFNLKGEGVETIEDHFLHINAEKFTPLKEGSIPEGEILLVDNTAMDFRKERLIIESIEDGFDQIKVGKGYDHNYVLNKSENHFAARVKESVSGRIMEVYTDQPGIQFYTANFLNGSDIGKSEKSYKRRSAFCLETQHFPDSPNQPHFPSTVLKQGESYTSFTSYKFSTD